MGLRVCLVTPFSWSQPHSVNEHVDGVARELRSRGHHVTVLAPSNRARELAAGRQILQSGADAELIAVGPAVPISRRSQMGVPVGARFNLDLAIGEGRYDVVHGIEPGLPSLSYLALRDAQTLAVASFFSPERLSYPPGKAQRERLLNRVDALLATTERTAAAAGERFPGDYRVVSEGVDVERFSPAPKRNVIAIEWRPSARPVARGVLRALRDLPGWEVVFVRTRSMFGRPFVPRAVLDRVRIETLRSGESRTELLNTSAIFVPAPQGLNRLRARGGRGRQRDRRSTRRRRAARARGRRGRASHRGCRAPRARGSQGARLG